MDHSDGAVKEDEVRVEFVHGVEGPSLYIDGTRYFGPKPWGGGTVAKSWKLTRQQAIATFQEVLDKLKKE